MEEAPLAGKRGVAGVTLLLIKGVRRRVHGMGRNACEAMVHDAARLGVLLARRLGHLLLHRHPTRWVIQ